MSIHEMYFGEYTDITEDLRRKDHVIFAGNEEGVYPDTEVGFSLIHYSIEPFWSTVFQDCKGKVGDVISYYDEANYVWFHCVIAYSAVKGWDCDGEGASNYTQIKEALDKIWDEHQDDYVRPFRCTFIGRGKMRSHGERKGNIVQTLAALADTECRVGIWTRVPS